MKVLHSAYMLKNEPGVFKQMLWEEKASKESSLEWEVRLFSAGQTDGKSSAVLVRYQGSNDRASGGLFYRVRDWYEFRSAYYSWLKSVSDKYDVIILRHALYDPFQYFYIKNIRKSVFTVHHTKEGPELKSGMGRLSALKAFAENLIGRLSIKSAVGVIGVTNEIRLYELERNSNNAKRSYVYPNGIEYERGSKVFVDNRSKALPEIIFVSSYFAPWHGLDLLLDSIESSCIDFKLHLVGRLSDHDRVRAENDQRIILHGFCDQEKVEDISSRCWIGLSSFALDRIGMREACTLKVREYLRNGLPVYAGYEDVFPSNFKYFKHGNPDITDIIDFAAQTFSSSRESVSDDAKMYINKQNLLNNLYSWLMERSDSRGDT